QKPVLIGFVASLTGSTSELGVNGRNGLLMAVEEVNAAGGVNGKAVEVVIKDDQNNPEVGLAVDRELQEAGISFIVGHMTSNMATLSVPFVNSQDMLMINPTMSATTLFGQDDHVIGVISPNSDQAAIIKESMVKDSVGKRVAVIYESQNLAYTKTVKDRIAQEIAPVGGQIIYEEAFLASNSTNYLDIAKRVLSTQSDSIVILASSFDAAMFCQQFYKLNNQTPIYLAAWSMNNDLLLQGGAAVEGVTITSLIDLESQAPAYMAFRDNYLKKYGAEPTFAAVYTYEATMLLLNTVAETANPNPEKVKQAILQKGIYPGLQNEITIDGYGDASRTIYEYVVKNGQFTKAE
ncbi:ABC transporter substrate-binding protein, partial [Acetobacterium wieringae]|uniref:ABC transporter substrate-binding protein n=1 Tax=Acetobacterium wieringae TaxID=52694 RepID=UPI002B21CEC5